MEAKTRRYPKKQQAIIETAETLFQRFGFKRVTVNEICQESGVSKMTFYKYYKNKTDLIKFLLSMWIEDAFAIAKKNKASNLKYVTAILARWNKSGKDNGYKPKEKKKARFHFRSFLMV